MPLNLVIGYKSRKSPEGAAVLICTNDGDAARAILDAANPDFPVRELVIRPQATKRRTDESASPAVAEASRLPAPEQPQEPQPAPEPSEAPAEESAPDPIAEAPPEEPAEDQPKKGIR